MLATEDIRRLLATCSDDLAGLRERAILLIAFAGALRRSELVALDVAHVSPTQAGLRLLIARSKSDQAGAGAEIGLSSGSAADTCPVAALKTWLKAAEIHEGPLFLSTLPISGAAFHDGTGTVTASYDPSRFLIATR